MNWISVTGSVQRCRLIPGEVPAVEAFLAPSVHAQPGRAPAAPSFVFRVLLYGSGAETVAALERHSGEVTASGRYDIVEQEDGTLTHEISGNALLANVVE